MKNRDTKLMRVIEALLQRTGESIRRKIDKQKRSNGKENTKTNS